MSDAINIGGIIRNTTKMNTPRGAMEEIVNLRRREGVLRPLCESQQIWFELREETDKYSQLFIHTGGNYKHILGIRKSDYMVVYVADADGDKATLKGLATGVKMEGAEVQNHQVGNLVVLSDGIGKLRYLLWYEGEYEEKDITHGEWLNGQPEIRIKPDMDADGVPQMYLTMGYISESANGAWDMSSSNVSANGLSLIAQSRALARQKGILNGFCVAVVCMRLYDGTFAYASKPVLLPQANDSGTRYRDVDNNYKTNPKPVNVWCNRERGSGTNPDRPYGDPDRTYLERKSDDMEIYRPHAGKLRALSDSVNPRFYRGVNFAEGTFQNPNASASDSGDAAFEQISLYERDYQKERSGRHLQGDAHMPMGCMYHVYKTGTSQDQTGEGYSFIRGSSVAHKHSKTDDYNLYHAGFDCYNPPNNFTILGMMYNSGDYLRSHYSDIIQDNKFTGWGVIMGNQIQIRLPKPNPDMEEVISEVCLFISDEVYYAEENNNTIDAKPLYSRQRHGSKTKIGECVYAKPKEDDTIKKEIEDTSVFHLVWSEKYKDITSDEWIDIDLSKKLNVLEDQESLNADASVNTVRQIINAKTSYLYNGRLHIGDITEEQFEGFGFDALKQSDPYKINAYSNFSSEDIEAADGQEIAGKLYCLSNAAANDNQKEFWWVPELYAEDDTKLYPAIWRTSDNEEYGVVRYYNGEKEVDSPVFYNEETNKYYIIEGGETYDLVKVVLNLNDSNHNQIWELIKDEPLITLTYIFGYNTSDRISDKVSEVKKYWNKRKGGGNYAFYPVCPGWAVNIRVVGEPKTCFIIVRLKTTEKVVQTGLTEKRRHFDSLNPMLFYPDSRCDRMTIGYVEGTDEQGNITFRARTFKMKAMSALEGAVYVADDVRPIDWWQDTTLYVQDASGTVYEIDDTGNRKDQEEYTQPLLAIDGETVVVRKISTTTYRRNVMKVSATDTPLIFPASNTYQVGNGVIRGFCANTIGLSTGQWGQEPLYAFCSDGVYAFSVDASGAMVYPNSRPISREVCNNPMSITPIDNAVVFSSERGLQTISGAQVTEISQPIEGRVLHFADNSHIDRLDSASLLLNHPAWLSVPTLPTAEEAIDYLKTTHIGWNYDNREVWVASPNSDYAYIFSEGMWSKVMRRIRYFINDYPNTYYVSDKDGMVYDLGRDNTTVPVETMFLTRPIVIGGESAKTFTRAWLYGDLHVAENGLTGKSRHKAAILVYGSEDGERFSLIGIGGSEGRTRNIVAKLHRMAMRYVRILYVGRLGSESRIECFQLEEKQAWGDLSSIKAR